MNKAQDYDLAGALAHLRDSDPTLAALIDRTGPCALQRTPTKSLFEAMLRSIVYQQLHAKAAATIHARVIVQLKLHGGMSPDAVMQASDTALRGAGLSANKLLAIRDLALRCKDRTVPSLAQAHRLSDEELITRLTSVRGIGTWTVHMLLIFYLGRPDVLPTGDFAIRLAFKNLYRKRTDPHPDVIIKHARRWQPYRSIASWYLWRAADAAKVGAQSKKA
jgi:DNA-3-methyladenine glycosylase II